MFFSQRDSFGFGNSVFGGGVEVHLISNQHFDGWIGLLVELHPLFYVLETGPFGHVEHIDAGCATERVAKCVLCVANARRNLPIIDTIDCLLFSEGHRFDGHLFRVLGILSFAKGLADS